jgi:nucleoside-diphosphate-sugar epimerase
MKRIMITGANGLLGRAIIEKICQLPYEIYAVISGKKAVSFPENVHIVKIDLLDDTKYRDLFEIRPDIMLHYAWAVQDVNFEKSADNIQWLGISLNLLRNFVLCGGKRILFAGSISEYGISNGKYQENSLSCPNLSLYGETKLSFSRIMKNYCVSNQVEYVDMRYCSVYGEGDNRLYAAIPKSITSFLQDETYFCKSPYNIWDYIYVHDAVEASIRLIDNSLLCGTINICSGIPYRMADIFSIISKELGKEHLLSFDWNNGLNRMSVGDVSRMECELGYKCETPFNVGIKRAID